MAIKFLSGQTITGNITLSGDITAATFNSLAINSTGTNNVANQIVRTQANGYANFGWINSVSGNHTGSITRITASNDAYLRYVTPAQFRTGVTDGYYASAGTVDGVTSVATGNGLSGGTITSTGTLTMSGSYTGDFTVTGLINGRGISSGQSGESNLANTTGETWIGSNGLRYNTGSNTFARTSATAQAAMIVLTDTADTEFYAQPSTSQTGTYALTPKMVIKGATGNVGIGDTTPSFPLVVSKSSSITTNSGDGSMRLSLINPDQTNNNYALITFSDGTSQPGSGFMGMQFTDHTNNYGELVFGTRGAGGYGERMRITSGGNVGIGATSPNEKLVLRETSNTATTTLKVEGGSYGFELSKTSQSADYVHLKPRGSSISVLRVMPNATNSDSYVEVWGSDYDNDTSNWNRAYMHLAASTGNFHIKTSSSGNRPVGKLILGTQNTSDAITILDNGNVGFSDTSPDLKLTVNGAIQRKNKRGNTGKHSVGHYDRGEAVWELDPTMSSQEIADLFGGTTSTVYWDQTSGQSSLAPGGWCLYLAGGVYVGGVYNSGFPYLPVETDSPTQADYYMECYIQNVGTSQTHYMGSNEFNEGFTSLGGHPGSYGYWVMANTDPGTSWTKVSGYIGGFSASTVGTFENGTKYWTPQALFNYGAGSGTRACRISGWKVYKVYQKGNRKLAGTLDVNSNINSETGYVRKSGVTSGGYIELGSLPGYAANAYQSLTSGGTIHFANNGKYCAYLEGANTYFGILNSSSITQVKFNTNGNSYINGGYLGIGNTTPGGTRSKLGVSFNVTGSAASLAESVTYATMELYPYRNGSTYGMFFGNKGLTDGYIQSANNVGGASGHIFLNPFGGNIGIGTGNTSPLTKLHIEGPNNNDGNDYAQLYIKGTGTYPADIAGIVLDSAGSNQSHIRFHNNGSPKVQIRYNEGNNAVDKLGVYSFVLGSNIAEFNNGTGDFVVKGDVTAYGSPSDKRLKENIKPIISALDKVSKLQGVTFDWKEKGITNLKEDIGFIAQDVQKIIPELVRENDNGMLSMRHQGIAPILLEAIKEQQKQIEDLQAQIKNISNTN